MTYMFFYVDNRGREYKFTNLSKHKAISMYKIFNRDMAIHGYKKVGWSVE